MSAPKQYHVTILRVTHAPAMYQCVQCSTDPRWREVLRSAQDTIGHVRDHEARGEFVLPTTLADLDYQLELELERARARVRR